MALFQRLQTHQIVGGSVRHIGVEAAQPCRTQTYGGEHRDGKAHHEVDQADPAAGSDTDHLPDRSG